MLDGGPGKDGIPAITDPKFTVAGLFSGLLPERAKTIAKIIRTERNIKEIVVLIFIKYSTLFVRDYLAALAHEESSFLKPSHACVYVQSIFSTSARRNAKGAAELNNKEK